MLHRGLCCVGLLIIVGMLGGCRFSDGMAWSDREWVRRLNVQPTEVQGQIVDAVVGIGMTKEQVLLSWGRPREVKLHDLHDEQWVYGSHAANSNRFLYFDQGKLVAAVRGDNRLFASDDNLDLPVKAPFRIRGQAWESESRTYRASAEQLLEAAEREGFIVSRKANEISDREPDEYPHVSAKIAVDGSELIVVAEGYVQARAKLWLAIESGVPK